MVKLYRCGQWLDKVYQLNWLAWTNLRIVFGTELSMLKTRAVGLVGVKLHTNSFEPRVFVCYVNST